MLIDCVWIPLDAHMYTHSGDGLGITNQGPRSCGPVYICTYIRKRVRVSERDKERQRDREIERERERDR